MDEPLSVDLLLAWGLDWQRHLERPGQGGFHLPLPVLTQYVAEANKALALLLVKPQKAARGGRPPGTGAGAQVDALIAKGVREDDAVRSIAKQREIPVEKVCAALQRHRRKKPPEFCLVA
jgi:hypothetical protein